MDKETVGLDGAAEGNQLVVGVVRQGVDNVSDQGRHAVTRQNEAENVVFEHTQTRFVAQKPDYKQLQPVADEEADYETYGLGRVATRRAEHPVFVPQERIDHSGNVADSVRHQRVNTQHRLAHQNHNQRHNRVQHTHTCILYKLSQMRLCLFTYCHSL